MKHIGTPLMILALFFTIYETALFGWNIFPKSLSELICDTGGVLLFIIGWGLNKSKN